MPGAPPATNVAHPQSPLPWPRHSRAILFFGAESASQVREGRVCAGAGCVIRAACNAGGWAPKERLVRIARHELATVRIEVASWVPPGLPLNVDALSTTCGDSLPPSAFGRRTSNCKMELSGLTDLLDNYWSGSHAGDHSSPGRSFHPRKTDPDGAVRSSRALPWALPGRSRESRRSGVPAPPLDATLYASE